MILVDTSVLINYFKGKENEQVNKLDKIIEHGIPFGINYLIYTEVLQGAKSKKEYEKLDKYLSTQIFYHLKSVPESYRESARLYIDCRKKGITIRSTIDVLIAWTAIENGLYLLHDDEDYSKIATVEKSLLEY